MRWPRSIGARLTLWYAAAFASALLVLGVVMWFAVQQSLYHAIDEGLRDRVDGIRVFIEDHKTRLDQEEVREEFRAHGEAFRVLDPNGAIVFSGEALAGAAVPELKDLAETPRFDDVAVQGVPLRFLSQVIAIDGKPYSVEVAAPLAALQQGLNDALWVLAPMLPLMLLLASAGGYFMSRRALAPVDRITQTARSITAENLSQRLAVPNTGDELERLSATLNEMIARLEAAFKKISRFTADASHELRTPLAVMRTTAEVALRNSEFAEHRTALEQVVAETERTSQLVDNLLLIAKADSGGTELSKRAMDLVAAVDEACAQANVLAHVKGIRVVRRLADRPISMTGDREALRRLFLILLDNAVKYTAEGGEIEIAIEERDGHASGSVKDTGIGIPAADIPFIFDRFYRVDRARSRALGGAGLGLAIARWIAEAHGGSLSVESELNRGSVFRVRLPTAELV
jgi:heavy metal sensor kinase